MNKKGFEIKAQADSATIFVYGGINVPDDEGYIVYRDEFIDEVKAIEADQIDVRIATIGGDTMAAAEMYQVLIDHRAKVRTIAESKVFSAGSMLLQSGDERISLPMAVIMVHSPASEYVKGRGTAGEHREMADAIDAHARAMVPAYTRHGITPEVVNGWLTSEKDIYFSAEQALEANLIDRIEESMPIGASAPEAYLIAAMGGNHQSTVQNSNKQSGVPTMGENENTGAQQGASENLDITAQHSATVQAAQDAGQRKEADRRKMIDMVFQVGQLGSFYTGDPLDPVTAVYRKCLDDVKCDELQTRTALLACLQTKSDQVIISPMQGSMEPSYTPPPNASPYIGGAAVIQADQRDKLSEGIELALLVKAGYEKDEKRRHEAKSNGFMGMGLIELGGEVMRAQGVDVRMVGDRMKQAQMILAAHSTSDFPNILENVASKAAMIGYNEAPETWMIWCKPGNLNDFKQAKRVSLSAFPDLDKIPESGEYQFATISDVGEPITLGTYGKKFRITRQAIINDDLNAFTDVPRKMGRAAARTPGNLAYSVLTTNAVLNQDGVALFAAGHNNFVASGSGAAPSIATLDAGYTAMGLQTDPDDNVTALNIEPQYLIVPRALRTTSRVVVGSEKDPTYDATNPGTPMNPFYNEFEVVSDARLDLVSTTGWYLAASPNQADTVEVAFLDGVQTPVVEQMENTSPDGRDFYVRLDCAAAALGYVGLYHNFGA